MKALRARYTPEAADLIRKLHPDIKRRIREAIRGLIESPLQGHELRFDLSGLRSRRVRSHRIIYRYNGNDRIVDILFVGHRRDVYESFRDLLTTAKRE
jgi:mRNA interferase RelE/StbE